MNKLIRKREISDFIEYVKDNFYGNNVLRVYFFNNDDDYITIGDCRDFAISKGKKAFQWLRYVKLDRRPDEEHIDAAVTFDRKTNRYVMEKLRWILTPNLTAFYIPENSDIMLHIFGCDIPLSSYSYNIPLQEILTEHHTLPNLNNDVIDYTNEFFHESNSEYIPEISNQEDYIIRNGIKYNRVIPIQPCFNLYDIPISISFSVQDLNKYIYLELNALDSTFEKKFFKYYIPHFDVIYERDT